MNKCLSCDHRVSTDVRGYEEIDIIICNGPMECGHTGAVVAILNELRLADYETFLVEGCDYYK